MKVGDVIRAYYCLVPRETQEIHAIVIALFKACAIYENCIDPRIEQVGVVVDKILSKTPESKIKVGKAVVLPYAYCTEIGQASLEELYTHPSEKVRAIADIVRGKRERNTYSAPFHAKGLGEA